jgi:exonuclease V gamma subunit
MTPVDIYVSLDGSQINGKIKTFFEDRLIYVCNSSSLLKHITRAWIQYLGIVASGVSAHFYFIYRNKESYKVEELSSDKLSSSEAKDILKKIVADYKVGHTGWFFFHPEFARENLTNIEKDYSSFMGWYEERIESKYEYRLKDVYLTKAVRNGFFEFENYPILQQNVLSFMLPLKELFPSLFE